MHRITGSVITVLLVLGAFALPAAGQDFPARPERVDTDRQGSVELDYNLRRGQSLTATLQVVQSVESLSDLAVLTPGFTLRLPVRLQVQSVDEEDGFTIVRTLGSPNLGGATQMHPDDQRTFQSGANGARLTEEYTPAGDRMARTSDLEPTGRPWGPTEAVLDLLALHFPVLPSEPLHIGDSWAQTHSLSFADTDGEARGSLTALYTVAGFAMSGGREQILVDIEWAIEMEGEAVLLNRQRDRLPMYANGHGTGHTLIDPATGLTSVLSGRIGTVFMLGSRESNRRRQVVDTHFSLTN